MLVITDIYSAPRHANDADFVISIVDPGHKFDHLKSKDKHIIVRFPDTEHPSEDEWMQMDSGVRQILAWVKQVGITKDHRLLVHCHAGISRSPAIAWLVSIMLGDDPLTSFQSMFKNRPRIWPNKTVLGMGSTFLNLPPDFMKLVHQVDAEIAMNRREYLGYGG